MKKHSNQEGFTLIEVIIALFVLTIGILGAFAMQGAAINGNSIASQITQAATLGGDRLETIMTLPYNDINNLQDVNNAVASNAGAAGLGNTDITGKAADYGPFTRDSFTLFYNIADDYPIVGTKTVRVIIRRSDKGTIKEISQDYTMMRPI